MLQYGSTPLHSGRGIFLPDALRDDGPFHSPHAFPQLHPQQHTRQGYPDSRAMQQYQQQRQQAPSPLASHGRSRAFEI